MAGDGSDVFGEFCAAGLWPGVGTAIVAQLREAGVTGPERITERVLAGLPSVTDKKARRLFASWVAAEPLFRVATLLVPLGLPVQWARRLVDAFGDAASERLAADPWLLLGHSPATVDQADRLARTAQPGVSPTDPRRLRALVDWALARDAREGHTACPAPLVADAVREFGIPAGAIFDEAVTAAVTAGLVVEVADPGGGDERWLARAALAAAEQAVARHLRRLVDAAEPFAGAKAARAAASGLDRTQTDAVVAAARGGVSLLTGGPGTGKSRTVAAVVTLCGSEGIEVALAAPTGRAAKRMSELLAGDGAEAMTIHRLLGARRAPSGEGSVFECDETNPIGAQMVVVDEASMLDVQLAAALLAAIPDGAHLLMVGDPAQLPSIGPGRVLADVLAAGRYPVTELTTLYRQAEGGAIARLAASVRRGELIAPDPADREVVIVPVDGSAAAGPRVVQLVTDSIPRVFGVADEQVQVITPVHRGPAGTQALNQVLKRTLNPGGRRGARSLRGFDVGDRVVATANHLDAEPTGYANGEVGTVIDIGGKSLLVTFPGGEAEVSGKALGDLLHGWAITVHRAQGSEWEAVVVVLPPEAGRMLSRPLIYTALTRARRHLSVVHAAGAAVVRAVRHVGARPRRTRLESLLAATGDGEPVATGGAHQAD